MRYLITGGSGYIGSRLTEMLADRGDVERIVNLDVRPPARPHPKATFVRGDVRDLGAVRKLLSDQEPDALVHLAFLLITSTCWVPVSAAASSGASNTRIG